jgi:hypothetical protein
MGSKVVPGTKTNGPTDRRSQYQLNWRETYMVETSVSTTTWTSGDAIREQDLQGSSATSEEAQTDCITSVNKVVQQLMSRIIVWLWKSCIRIGKLLQN